MLYCKRLIASTSARLIQNILTQKSRNDNIKFMGYMYKNNREGNFQSSASQIWEYFGDNGHVADDDECHEGGADGNADDDQYGDN